MNEEEKTAEAYEIELSEEGSKSLLEALDEPPVPERVLERARKRRGVIRHLGFQLDKHWGRDD